MAWTTGLRISVVGPGAKMLSVPAFLFLVSMVSFLLFTPISAPLREIYGVVIHSYSPDAEEVEKPI